VFQQLRLGVGDAVRVCVHECVVEEFVEGVQVHVEECSLPAPLDGVQFRGHLLVGWMNGGASHAGSRWLGGRV
jgi:hypothetical protein